MDTLVTRMFPGKRLDGKDWMMRMKNLFNRLFRKSEDKISDKDKLTAMGEPYVRVLSMEMNKDNPSEGYFELDWNRPFVEKLRAAGYTGNSEEEIVDSWFTALCRNIGEDMN